MYNKIYKKSVNKLLQAYMLLLADKITLIMDSHAAMLQCSQICHKLLKSSIT